MSSSWLTNYRYYLQYRRSVGRAAQDRVLDNGERCDPDSYMGKLKRLYDEVVAVGPQRVVELGVMHGFSTRVILKALEKNGRGHLDSIDMNRTTPIGKETGHIVESALRMRWTLHFGTFDEVLPRIPRPDFVFEDVGQWSPWEKAMFPAWDLLEPGGVFFVSSTLSHAEYDSFVRATVPGGWADKADEGFSRIASWGILKKPTT